MGATRPWSQGRLRHQWLRINEKQTPTEPLFQTERKNMIVFHMLIPLGITDCTVSIFVKQTVLVWIIIIIIP